MKLIALGDTHGRNLWKEIIAKESDADKIVFIGDYWDSHDEISFEIQRDNFIDICDYKEKNLDKVILLTGNHDCHYFTEFINAGESFSSFQYWHVKEINGLLEKNRKLLQMACMHDNFLFTHAGVTHRWLDNNNYKEENVVDFINNLFRTQLYESFKFTGFESHGDSITQSPIWVRPRSLMKNAFRYETIKQVVGHTTMNKLIPHKDKFFFIDTLGTSKEYLVLEDDKIIVKNI